MKKNELKVEYVPKSELKTYANNAKLHTPEQVEGIKKSIQQLGFNDPIAIWKDNTIIEGHGRLMAAMEMDDITEVPVIRLDGLTDKERRAYIIAHNKLTLKTDFDSDLLGEELKEIMDDFDMTDFGFGDFELTMLTEDFEPTPYDDSEIASFNKGDVGLAKKRVMITFTEDEEDKIKELLGVDEITKVVYDIKEIR